MRSRMQARITILATLLVVTGAARCFADAPQPAQAAVQGNAANGSFDDYRRHYETLIMLTLKCAKGRNVDSCNPQSIGADDHVQLS